MNVRLLGTIKKIVLVILAVSTFSQRSEAIDNSSLIETGKLLFSDPALSSEDVGVACADCHPNSGQTDNKTYIGLNIVADGNPTGRSTPTLWGIGTRSAFGWAGTSPSLKANIKGIIVNRMKGDSPSEDVLNALSAYVQSLNPQPARYIGTDGVPTVDAPANVERGFELFVGIGGCGVCHLLPTLDKADSEDVGTGGVFKVPALWSVRTTAPYFHDGRFSTLESAVRVMWDISTEFSEKRTFPTDQQISDLLAYLEAL